MKADTSDQLQVLTRERSRLAHRLEQEPGWRMLNELAAREARGEWIDGAERAAERKSLETDLAVNTVYLAWKKLGEVINLLEPTTPAPLVATESVMLLSQPEAQSRSGPELAAAPRLAPKAKPASPLLRIKGMDEATAALLIDRGVTTLAQIAAWTANDVTAVRHDLGLGRRLSQQGWIEQAALVARDDQTDTVAAPSSMPGTMPAAPIEGPGVIDVVAGAMPAPAAAMSGAKSSSLTARLFARTPITGPQRSLLAAIEAAEQARLRPAPSVSGVDLVFTDSSLPKPVPSEDAGSAKDAVSRFPSKASSPTTTMSAAPASGAPGRPVIDKVTSAEHPLVAPLEDEAEVAIVRRSDGVKPRQAAPRQERREVILPLDHEAQGGEDYEPRTIAAFRGSIEEASVDIVVRRPSKQASSASTGQTTSKTASGKP